MQHTAVRSVLMGGGWAAVLRTDGSRLMGRGADACAVYAMSGGATSASRAA